MSFLTAPPVALASYAVVIVGSHLTGLMDTIMRNAWAGQLEHLVYLLVGCQFFVLVVGHEPIRWRLGTPARWLLLAVAMAVDTFTGIVLLQGTHAVAMVSDPHVMVDALSDTRTGGAIMWFGGDAIMIAVMIVLAVDWLRRVDTDRADRKGWLEQARVATFTEHTAATSDVETFDDDDGGPGVLQRVAGQARPLALTRPRSERYSTPREKVDSRSWREYARKAMWVSVCSTPGHLRQPARDRVGDVVELLDADDRDQVDVAGDGVDLADAVDVGDLLRHLGDLVGLDGDHDDRGNHEAIS